MNLVGKIFTVLIFVMSLVFASFCVMVYGAHKNWEEVVNNPESEVSADKPLGLTYQNQNLNAKNDDLQNQLDKTVKDAERERVSNRKALTAVETTNAQQRDLLKVQDDRIATLTGLEREANASIAAIGASLANLRVEVAGLREDIDTTEAESADRFEQLVQVTEELHAKANEYKLLLEQSRRVAQALIVAKAVAIRAGLNPEAPVDTGIPPLVNGDVQAVRASGLIEISIGSDDGLEVGHELQVYRVLPTVNTYLGKVEVTDVEPDRAVCKVLNNFRRGAIQVGDSVASNLSTGS